MDMTEQYGFTLRCENGNYFLIELLEVHGFPEQTHFMGGYDTSSFIEIQTTNYHGKGVVYISTGQIYDFYRQLEKANKSLNGSAKLNSYEGTLSIEITFDGLGHLTIEGHFQVDRSLKNELLFEIFTDQTFISESLNGLKLIADKYGDNFGTKNMK